MTVINLKQLSDEITDLVSGLLWRQNTLKRMAADLVAAEGPFDRCDAIRVLHAAGHSAAVIHILVDEAQALAFQEIVAEVMSHG